MKSGHVYLMRAENGLCKIGGTRHDPEDRLATIRSHSPIAIELIRAIKFDNWRPVEMHLHRVYRSKRKHGEWFELSREDIDDFENAIHRKPEPRQGESSVIKPLLTRRAIRHIVDAVGRSIIRDRLDISSSAISSWLSGRSHPPFASMEKLHELWEEAGCDGEILWCIYREDTAETAKTVAQAS